MYCTYYCIIRYNTASVLSGWYISTQEVQSTCTYEYKGSIKASTKEYLHTRLGTNESFRSQVSFCFPLFPPKCPLFSEKFSGISNNLITHLTGPKTTRSVGGLGWAQHRITPSQTTASVTIRFELAVGAGSKSDSGGSDISVRL